MTQTNCLCGSGLNYADCCGLYHSHSKTPATAEALMRSRFTAYAMHNEQYLRETWVADKRPDTIDFSNEQAQWTRLEVVSVKKGGIKDSKGLVEFKAYYLQDGNEHVMNELSRFKKDTGKWLYLDGLVKSIKKAGQTTNQGKNAPCVCGSGKKFKRCCGST